MDRFSQRQAVILLAATNRPDELDEALLRSGRIDRELHVGLPSEAQRCAIFQVKEGRSPAHRKGASTQQKGEPGHS